MSNEFTTKQELKDKRKNIKSFNDLVEFLKDVDEHYNIGYGDAPRAIAQAALATAWYLSGRFGITGFQAGATLGDFIEDWSGIGNITNCVKLVDYDNLLYPQYEHRMTDKSISSDVWRKVQKAAKDFLSEFSESKTFVHPDVVNHWRSIVDGKVPFGFCIKD